MAPDESTVNAPLAATMSIAPASGSPAPAVIYQRNSDGSVYFHGGTWIVPFTPPPGQSLSDVGFVFEAPAWTPDQPITVTVQLFSSRQTTAIGNTNLTPFDSTPTPTYGNIPIWPPHAIAAGETFSLVFSPQDQSGNYSTRDTKIDSCTATTLTTTCSLNVSYASMTASSIGIVSNTDCDSTSGDVGALSVTYSGQNHSLGAWNPVCGRKPGISLGLAFGSATTATFVLAVFSADGVPLTSCSSVLAVRP